MQALKLRRLISNDFAQVWASGVDLLLTPVTLSEAPHYSEFSKKDNREQCATQDYCTQPANLAGIKLTFIRVEFVNLTFSCRLPCCVYSHFFVEEWNAFGTSAVSTKFWRKYNVECG